MRIRSLLALLALGVAVSPALAASPALSTVVPRGVQRGAEHDLKFVGQRLEDAQEILFYSPGFEVTSLEAKGNEVLAKVKVAPDCRLGEHVVQVRTATGVSDYRTLFVGALPAVEEVEPNSTFEAPQAIAQDVTVQGVVTGEDVDYFVVEAKQGERLSVEVEGLRLGNTLFDPFVAILDEKRFELVAADDSPLVRQDSIVSIVVPADGKYIVMVRDSSYGGNGASYYRAHIGRFPRPIAAYPAGGKLGESTEVKFIGDAAGELSQVVVAPAASDDDFGVFAEDAQGISPSPIPFRLSPHGNVLEQEPNNELAQGSPAELPLALNGIIGEAGDIDCFKFTATKGQVFEVECFARRIRSPLDPVVNLYNAQGGGIAGNDDSRGPDSYFRFTAPADGEYILRVTDHLGRGGPDFVYRVEFQPVQPSVSVSIPRVQRYAQTRQQIVVPRGGRFATLINATRTNFGGELVLEAADLPAGVTMVCDSMPADGSSMPVLFEAAADAPVGGKLVDLLVHNTDANNPIRGGFTNRADFVIGAPGQSLYVWKDVNRVPVVVVNEAPFSLEIVEPKAPLVRNGAMQLKIVAHRQEGFTKPINIEFPFRPAGVSAGSNVTIPEGQNEALYPLNAAGNAQVKAWRVYALGIADVGGQLLVSSQLAPLTVAEPYITFEAQRASCEQGQEAQIYCKVNQVTPFEGEATATLLGLPPKTSCEPVTFTKETTELVFKVKTEAEAPVGQHKNLICQVSLQVQGEPVVATAGVTDLQIDKPLPAPTTPAPMPAATAAPMPAAAPAPAPARPLSRLEKLREAAKAAKAAAGQ